MIEKISIFYLFTLFYLSTATSQDKVATGLSPEDVKFIRENKTKGSIPSITRQAPEKHLPVSLDQYLPSVLDQGTQGSCTAFAVAEALSIRENYLNKKPRSTSIKSSQVLYSPTYIWVQGNQSRPPSTDCKTDGISYSTAFSCLFTDKIVYWDVFPYPANNKDLCHSKCPDSVLKKKIKDRKFGYHDVKIDVGAFKDLLSQGYPICIATYLDMGYYEAYYGKGNWTGQRLPRTGQEHAMVVVDYDDEAKRFKVLDSHGTNSSDNGFIWLNYNLVNHNLDAGAVFGAYIVSFDKNLKEGPKKSIHYTSASVQRDDVKLMAEYIDSAFVGQIVDKIGAGIANVTVEIKESRKATITDLEGYFKIVAEPDATLTISAVGFTSKQAVLKYNYSKVYESDLFETWTKKGYYRIFNEVRIGVVNLNRRNNFVQLSITDDNTGKLLTNSIELKVGELAHFTVNDKVFGLKLKSIKHAGSLFNLINWNGAYIEYSLDSPSGKLTQFF